MPEQENTDNSNVGSSTDKTVWETREPTETVVNPAPETPADDPKVFDKEYVEKVRREAAEYRTRLRDQESKAEKLAEKVAEFERASLSDEERRKQDFEQLQAENRKLRNGAQETLLEAAVAKNVVKFELADADATLKLLDKGEVTFGDDGRPDNIDSVLEATLERYPFLKATAPKRGVDTGATNPGKQRKGGSLTREQVQSMSHDERAERMPEIMKWAKNGYK